MHKSTIIEFFYRNGYITKRQKNISEVGCLYPIGDQLGNTLNQEFYILDNN